MGRGNVDECRIMVDAGEVGQIIKEEILKRELVESEEAKAALGRVNRFYKKQSKGVSVRYHDIVYAHHQDCS